MSDEEIRVYEYPIMGYQNDFTQKLILMKEKVDQFNKYFHSKKPYFLKGKVKESNDVEKKVVRKKSLILGTNHPKIMNIPPAKNIPQDLSDKTKSISTIKALSSQLKNKIDNRSQKEASKQTEDISANSLSDSQEYNSIVETFNESNKIIKPEMDISYLRKQTHR